MKTYDICLEIYETVNTSVTKVEKESEASRDIILGNLKRFLVAMIFYPNHFPVVFTL